MVEAKGKNQEQVARLSLMFRRERERAQSSTLATEEGGC